jgi:flagellar hook assembly protein FlgD
MGWLPRTTIVTGVTPGASPAGMAMQGAPNPFRASTSLRLSLPTSGMVELTVLDVSGRSVRELAHAWMPAGAHLIAWDGTDRDGRTVPAGVYLTRLKVGTASVTQRIVRIQ